MNDIDKPKFYRGDLVITDHAAEVLNQTDIFTALRRHSSGDWGIIDDAEWAENERSLKEGGRLFSVHHSAEGKTFWVITESDRSITTVLMPEDT